MYRNGCKPCPPKKKPKKKSDYKKIGAATILLGIVTACVLLLPLKYWVILMSIVLIICGILLLKK